MNSYDCIVVGGGASGVMAALSVREHFPEARVLLLEKEFQLLRKVQASGNGRCNLTNRDIGPEQYFSLNSGDKSKHRFLKTAFNIFSYENTKEYFMKLGIPLYVDQYNRAYPHSEQASIIENTLVRALQTSNIDVFILAEVAQITNTNTGLELEVSAKESSKSKLKFNSLIRNNKFRCKKLVFACGSKAAQNLGGSESGYLLLKKFAELSTLKPALVPINLQQNTLMHGLAGQRFKGSAQLLNNNQVLTVTRGEFLFTETGLSGIAGMELARFIPDKNEKNKISVLIDFAPDYSQIELKNILKSRQIQLKDKDLSEISVGIVKDKIAAFLGKQAKSLDHLCSLLKASEFEVIGTKGFEYAQVVAGGLDLSQVYLPSLALKSNPNVYVCGELLDIDGKTGGFNLQWAWTSGYIAGKLSEIF